MAYLMHYSPDLLKFSLLRDFTVFAYIFSTMRYTDRM